MKWIEALKAWNKEHNAGKWCVPRKGSTEYDAVRKYMAGEAKASEQKAPEKAPEKAAERVRVTKPIMVHKDLKKIIEAGPEENRKEVLRLIEEGKKRASAKEKMKKFLRKVMRERAANKIVTTPPQKEEAKKEEVKEERKMESVAELLESDRASFWDTILLAGYNEKKWTIPMLPTESKQANVIKQHYPSLPNHLVNKMLRDVNKIRRKLREESKKKAAVEEGRQKAQTAELPLAEGVRRALKATFPVKGGLEKRDFLVNLGFYSKLSKKKREEMFKSLPNAFTKEQVEEILRKL